MDYLKRLGRTDIQVSILMLTILFGGLLLLPLSWFPFWAVPLFILYVRMHYVIMTREKMLLDGRQRTAGADRG